MAGEKLRVRSGNAAGTAIDPSGGFTFGRSQPGQGTLAGDPELSREHARITTAPGGGLTIEDLGSTNGTFVNGQRVTGAQPLRPGDTVKVGQTEMVVEGDDQATALGGAAAGAAGATVIGGDAPTTAAPTPPTPPPGPPTPPPGPPPGAGPPVGGPPPLAGPPPVGGPPPGPGGIPPGPPGYGRPPGDGGGNRNLIIALIAIAVLAIGGGVAALLLLGGDDEKEGGAKPATPPPTTTPATPPPPDTEPPGSTGEAADVEDTIRDFADANGKADIESWCALSTARYQRNHGADPSNCESGRLSKSDTRGEDILSFDTTITGEKAKSTFVFEDGSSGTAVLREQGGRWKIDSFG